MPESGLIECVLLVNSKKQVIKQLPQNYENQAILKSVGEFCFPWQQVQNSTSSIQEFTFVQTQQDVVRFYGFVRLKLSENRAIVLISKFQDFAHTFMQILRVVEKDWENIKINSDNTKTVGHTDSNSEYPELTNSSNTSITLSNATTSLFTLSPTSLSPGTHIQLPLTVSQNLQAITPDKRYLPRTENCQYLLEFVAYYKNDKSPNLHRLKALISIYCSIMHERVIILLSENLSIVTSLLHAFSSLIFPLNWEHMFTPILPASMIQYVGAPFPALIGIHKSLLYEAEPFIDKTNVLIVDLDQTDTSPIINDPYQDDKSLPGEVVQFLLEKLEKVYTQGDDLSQTFLDAQAKLLAGYHDGFKIDLDRKLQYSFEEFPNIKRKWIMKHKHPYFEVMITLQCFKQFIDNQLDALNKNSPPPHSAVFDEAVRKVENDNQLTAAFSFAKAKAKTVGKSAAFKINTTTQKAAGNFSLRKQGVQSPANLRSGKITSDLISTPVLVNTTNRKINDLQPTRNFIQSSSSSSNSDSDGSHRTSTSPNSNHTKQQPKAQPSPAPKSRPWVNDEKAKIYREQFAQRKAQEEKRRASIDIVEIKPITGMDTDSAVITVQVPPPRFMSEEIDTAGATSIFGENLTNEETLIDFAPEPITRNSVLKQSISTRPISSLEELKMDNFTDDLLKTFNQISHNDTTSTYDNDTLSRRRKPEIAGENTIAAPNSSVLLAPRALESHVLASSVLASQVSVPHVSKTKQTILAPNQVPVPSPRNLSNETVPVPKPRTNWVQFD